MIVCFVDIVTLLTNHCLRFLFIIEQNKNKLHTGTVNNLTLTNDIALSNIMYLFYGNMGFKPLDTTPLIENLVSYMFVIQDIYLSELLS